jgi:hypothetical protein
MAAVTKGTAYAWGVDPIATVPITVVSYSIAKKFGVEAYVEDENGRRVALRYDDIETELTLEGTLKISVGALPEIGTNITYKSTTFIIREIENRGEAKGHTKISIKASNFEGISLA